MTPTHTSPGPHPSDDRDSLGGTPGQAGDAASASSELLAAAARGDPDAWRELVGLYGRRVFAMVYSRFRNRELAEELTQSVFATISVKIAAGEYSEEGRFEAWLMRVTMNRVRDEARRVKRQAAPTDPATIAQAAQGVVDEPREEDDPARFRSLRSALARLPEPDREIVAMRHHGQMSFKQMADVLGEPVGTLLARHHRALRKLKELMESADPERESTRPPRRTADHPPDRPPDHGPDPPHGRQPRDASPNTRPR